MTRTSEIGENEYISLKKQALRDKDKLNLKAMNPSERYEMATERAKSLHFSNDEKEKIYIANLLIPDTEEFLKIYVDECGKQTNVCAKRLEVPQAIIFARVYEINKFSKYLKKGDLDMSNIEIIEDAFEEKKDVSKKVDDETAEAIAKINTLFHSNDSKSEAIERQAESITRLNHRIDDLEEDVKEKDDTINSQASKIRTLEAKLAEADKQIKFLNDYKDAYIKIINTLNAQKEEDKEINKKI